MDIKWRIEALQQSILDSNDKIVFLHERGHVIEGSPFPVFMSQYDKNRLTITTLDQLHDARAFMRKLFGKWEDTFGQIFYSGGVIATWRGNHEPWEIWLETSIKDFPKELMPSDTCKFVKAENDDYRLECSLPASGDA